MAFCTKCGKQLLPAANFCSGCGARISPLVVMQSQADSQPQTAPQPQAAPQPQFVPQPQPVQQPIQPSPAAAQYDRDFAGVKVRYRCPSGHVFNGTPDQEKCPTCQALLEKGGYIQVYRMGHMAGAAVGMGIYVDEQPYGHLANKESVRISVPYGAHQLHITHTTTRDSTRPTLFISSSTPYVFCKAHFARGGFFIAIEESDPADMPKR
ncbi:MAG: zinc-ribbon domain-containing protein [Clostridia bacterium]|nr:zinc-ribbon domain-containing protein [Clostridia bacterium]